MHRAAIVRFWEACPGIVRLSYIALTLGRIHLMQPGKSKFSCTAASCKDTMCKRNMKKLALSTSAQKRIGVIAQPTSVHVHVHCIREDFLNTNINL